MAVFLGKLERLLCGNFCGWKRKTENGRTVVKCKTPGWGKEEEMIHWKTKHTHTHIQVVEYDD